MGTQNGARMAANKDKRETVRHNGGKTSTRRKLPNAPFNT